MRTLSMLHKLIQVGLALVLMSIAPLSVAPAQAEEEYFFGAWVEFCSPDTGLVVINGVDTRQPWEPFTFDWGDGNIELSWFAGRHTYADTSQSYTVTIESVLGGETTVEVDFSQCPALEIQAWVDVIDHASGFVVINGFIRGDPLVQVDWGDGSQPDASFFPVSHTYADTGQEYQVTITGTYHDGSLATFILSITFTPPDLHRIEAWTTLEPYRILGYGWDFGASVQVVVDDPNSGEVFLDTVVSPMPAWWDASYPLVNLEVAKGMLLPGRRITLDDGASRRELILSDVAVTLVNVFTDRVDGTASPGTRIETGFCNDDGARCAFRWMVTGEDGTWFADFAHPMGTGNLAEDTTVEITPYHYSTVIVRDEDDDKTVVHWVGLMPIIETNLSENLIWTYDWPTGGDATLEIKQGDETVYTASFVLASPEWNPDIFVARLELGDFRLMPGQVVTMRNADFEKTLEVADLRVTRVDARADTIEGYAPPGAVVDTSYLCDDEDCAWRLSTADETGYWKADYSQPSGLNNGDPAFENTFDIQPNFCNDARIFDPDRDITLVHWCAPPEFQDYGIYVFNADTGAVTLVTKNLPDTDEFNPAWSPSGRQIAHDVVVQGISHGIYITDVKTGISVPLKGAQDGGNNAAWSPNSKWIVFDRVPAGDPSLYLVPSAGGTPKLIRSDAINADWAPSGKRLVFQQPSDGSIRTMAVDGGKGAETLIAAQGASPVWSPDGRWIAYEYEGDIWKVQVNDQGKALGAPMRVTNNPFPEGHPTWTPDSKNIVFHADVGTGFDVWRIPARGGTPVRLAGAPDAGDYDPACAPKGRMVAYGSPSRR